VLNNHDTPVFCVMLDAIKAFDSVHFIKLFEILLRNGLCPLLARFLANLYTTQKMCVKWGDHSSILFNVRNGVKQGGVLSPILFNLYIGELVEKFSKTGNGLLYRSYFYGGVCIR
jgi:hypothetical protein